MANLARFGRGTRTFLRHEELECRILLSASTSDVTSNAPAYTTAAAGSLADGVFDFGISETEVQYSPIGPPAYMAGMVTFDACHGLAECHLGVAS